MTIDADKAREIQLVRHLEGELTLDIFTVAEVAVPEPGPGEVLVRTDYIGLGATFLEMMRSDSTLPIPPFPVGQRVGGIALGTVVRSESPALAAGDLVQGMTGWSEYSVGKAETYVKLDRDQFPSPVYYLGQGPTAYYGTADIAKVGEGDVVFVSGASGGVGSLAGQIAKNRGAAKVIGSAGSPEKVRYLVEELGFDAAFDYHDGPVVDRLRELAPDGITVFFDNVGGEQFDAAVEVARPGARFALCGSLSTQLGSAKDRFPEPDLRRAQEKNIEVNRFSTYHTPEQIMAWFTHFGTWLAEGRFVFPHTVVTGDITDVPKAMLGLVHGEHRGNVSVKVTKD